MERNKLEILIEDKFPSFGAVRLHDLVLIKSEKRFAVTILTEHSAAENDRTEAEKYLSELLSLPVTLKLTKAYCDEDYIRTRIGRFFAKVGGELKPILRRLDYDVVKEENCYKLIFFGGKGFCEYMEGALKSKLSEYLYRGFIENFEIMTVDSGEEPVIVNKQEPVLRAVNVTDREMFIGKPSTEMPGFICDIKGEYDNAVICGRVSELTEKTRKKPPKENARNKNPRYVTFNITDPSGTFPCILFPSIRDTDRVLDNMDNMECILTGRISKNFYGELNMSVNTVTACKVLTTAPPKDDNIKEEPVYYTTVFPDPLVVYEQDNVLVKKKSLDLHKFKGKTIVVFDLETTGINRDSDRIIEIGAVKLVDGEYTEKFSTLVNPDGVEISEGAQKVNHITEEMVKDAPKIEEVIPDFYKFCFGATLCGHNIRDFDMGFIKKWGNACGYAFNNKIIDTYELAIRYVKGLKNNKLSSLCEKYGVQNENAHRAYEDCVANAGVLLRIIDEYREIEL